MVVPVSRAPRTRYASRGDLDIAYQVIGDGPADLVVMPGPFVPIDSIDSEPSMHRFYRRLSSFCRVIRFDHRGMGMSSRIGADKITPACWAEDAVTVMDAIGCESATIICSGYTAMSALFLAADGTSRVQVEKNGKLKFIQVKPGLSADGFVEITPVNGNLSAGELVLVGYEKSE